MLAYFLYITISFLREFRTLSSPLISSTPNLLSPEFNSCLPISSLVFPCLHFSIFLISSNLKCSVLFCSVLFCFVLLFLCSVLFCYVLFSFFCVLSWSPFSVSCSIVFCSVLFILLSLSLSLSLSSPPSVSSYPFSISLICSPVDYSTSQHENQQHWKEDYTEPTL